MTLLRRARRLAELVGLEVRRNLPRTNYLLRRKLLIESFDITHVFDVGANQGNYGTELREIGYKGMITSIEPLSDAFVALQARGERDPKWKALRIGLGDQDGELTLHVSNNSESSSFLEMLPSHLGAAPDSRYVEDETVPVKRLDSIFETISSPGEEVFLKIDAQGYEDRILDGAAGCIRSINTIQLEMSLVPLYRGECLFPQMTRRLYDLGFVLVSIEPGHTDLLTGQSFQVDGIFHRFSLSQVKNAVRE